MFRFNCLFTFVLGVALWDSFLGGNESVAFAIVGSKNLYLICQCQEVYIF